MIKFNFITYNFLYPIWTLRDLACHHREQVPLFISLTWCLLLIFRQNLFLISLSRRSRKKIIKNDANSHSLCGVSGLNEITHNNLLNLSRLEYNFSRSSLEIPNYKFTHAAINIWERERRKIQIKFFCQFINEIFFSVVLPFIGQWDDKF